MMTRKTFNYILFFFIITVGVQAQKINLKFVETSDVHGNYFSYDFENKKKQVGSLEEISYYLNEQRKIYGNRLLYFDNGDLIQGKPSSYYYNYIDTLSTNVAMAMLNYMKCNAGNVGNHDVETGHKVYDKCFKECQFPILGANIIRISDGKPYLKPYEIFIRDGVKIVVLGMITSAVPSWLPEDLYSGLYFEDMLVCAKKWVSIIKENEKPDILIGLFHSGVNAFVYSERYNENASQTVAEEVPGFDVIMAGHDHQKAVYKIKNNAGDSVLIVNPGSRAAYVATVDMQLTRLEKGIIKKEISGSLVKMQGLSKKNSDFRRHFHKQFEEVKKFSSKKIGRILTPMSEDDAFLGSSSWIDLIHQLQLEQTGADISFVAPLSSGTVIPVGDLYVSDMFKLYRFENNLCTMSLTGREVKNVLEMSYSLWTNQMKTPNDHLLLIEKDCADDFCYSFKNFSFNFDSAAGIIYTVDVTKPQGQKITILRMANGTPFFMDSKYRVAVNSYRANGGGQLLTLGAGISFEELPSRIISMEEHNIRYYLIEYVMKNKVIDPKPLNQWKFIPESWAQPAIKKDYGLLKKESAN